MKQWKQLNSAKNKILNFTKEEIDNNSLPTTMEDGTPIPLLNFGVCVDNLDVYYWNGGQWVKSE